MNASARSQKESWSGHVPARPHTLIIGIGNPLRGDDGLGWAVAEQLARDRSIDGVIRTVHQLTPELAQEMAAVPLVIMVDASREGEPGDLCMRSLTLPVEPHPASTHATTPEELAALTATIYDHCPPVVIVTMVGADFDLGERCSTLITERLPLICAAVRMVLNAENTL